MEILPSRPINLDETLTYYVSPKGEIRLAPDSRITKPETLRLQGWRCVEAKTAREKEQVALQMSRQLFERKKKLKVEQKIREQGVRDMLRANARIRLAKSTNQFDALCQQSIIDKMDKEDEMFFKELAEEFDPSKRTSGLEMEWKEAPIGFAARGEKAQGLSLG